MITIDPPSNVRVQPALSKSGLGRFLRSARRAAGLEGEVHVLLADDVTLRRLNRTFRGKNQATDVLSFPACVSSGGDGIGIAGDVAISLETAARQAARFGHTLRDEVRVLLLHGVLHLAGFDHEADGGEMAAREAELRRELRLPVGLIARGGGTAVAKNGQRRGVGRKVRTAEVRSGVSGSFASAQDDDLKARDDGSKEKSDRGRSKRVRA